MNEGVVFDKNTLQVLLSTLRKIGTTIQNVGDQIVPELETTSKDLNSMRIHYDSLQNDLNSLISQFETTQKQITSNIPLMKDSLSSQHQRFLENKEAILSMEKHTNEHLNDIMEELKTYINSQISKQKESVTDDILNLSENILPNIIANITNLGKMLVEIRRTVLGLESKLTSPSGIISDIIIEGDVQDVLQSFPRQITYKSKDHKVIVLNILDGLINNFSGKTISIDELEGSFIKQMFINARTQVYEKTEGIAPRFRQAMDTLIALFQDGAVYPISNLESVVRSLRDIRKMYETAPVVP